jgi:hypothetical protein
MGMFMLAQLKLRSELGAYWLFHQIFYEKL